MAKIVILNYPHHRDHYHELLINGDFSLSSPFTDVSCCDYVDRNSL